MQGELTVKDLVFIGGAKGVGKTAIIERMIQSYPIKTTNTGKIFISARDIGENPENKIYSSLASFQGIVDTHYAGYLGEGFIRGMSREHLLNLYETKSIELVLIDLDIETLIQRISNDTNRIRKINKEHAKMELEMNRQYFNEYCKDLLISGLAVTNLKIESTIETILEKIK
jgi:adenylate kinase